MRKVITYGVFDLFHDGHRRLLERARALGDYLIVGVTDNVYDEERGKFGTVDSFEVRAANVMASGFADEVITEDHFGQKAEDILKYGIDVFAIGSDWVGKFDALRAYCEVVYLNRTPGISSSALRAERFPTPRLGIIGSGRITRRFIPEARAMGRIDVSGVFNPRLESAVLLQSQFKLGFATDDLDKLFSEVDAVYVATPHQMHVDYARAALLAGKHVLVEKPLALTRAEAEELYALADEKGLVLLEALKTAYCPGYFQVIEMARKGLIGDIFDIESCFTRLTLPGSRERDDAQFGGSFLELGSYVLLPALDLFGCEPDEVSFDVVHDKNGLDLFCKVRLRYGERYAQGKVGLGVKSEGQLIMSGTEGNIVVAAPWWKTGRCEIHREDPTQVEQHQYDIAGDGLRYEISEFVHRIAGHEGRRDRMPAHMSIAMADIMERFLDQEGRGK